ncbi:hypothetical protein AYI68_g131 [Smittium mucronatum]|uniref:Uncharacterized protein n=1 Tax=Smittium mucronatum TaxID=133383 RepID=A0A1R0H998_9FUNG|nr:hypothetical protein AYI68_g131 [Smittium mucronatum]
MCMVMRNHELVESGAYPYGFATFRSQPPVRFSPIIPTVGAVQTLSVVSTGSNGRIVDRGSNGAIPALKSLLCEGEEYSSISLIEFASPLAAKQQFRSEGLYQFNWNSESNSENI